MGFSPRNRMIRLSSGIPALLLPSIGGRLSATLTIQFLVNSFPSHITVRSSTGEASMEKKNKKKLYWCLEKLYWFFYIYKLPAGQLNKSQKLCQKSKKKGELFSTNRFYGRRRLCIIIKRRIITVLSLRPRTWHFPKQRTGSSRL